MALLAAQPRYALHPASVTAAAARRFFNSGGAWLGRDKDGNYKEPSDEDRLRRARIPMFFSADGLDPFGEPARLCRLLALMEDEAAAAASSSAASSSAMCEWWASKEDDDVVQLKVAMPGLGKDHVKLTVEENILVIKGERDPKEGDDQGPARYSRRINVPSEAFEMQQKAEMDQGMLKVTLPKIKNNEQKAAVVFEIKIE
ncbi:unnamed protein product [Urochloa decumbens]|uniref:SHSP domain-containing protein n=1 Tax=Urochloa decumbens TaxID=240449 RepID=A0ABC9GWX3_9POAL